MGVLVGVYVAEGLDMGIVVAEGIIVDVIVGESGKVSPGISVTTVVVTEINTTSLV